MIQRFRVNVIDDGVAKAAMTATRLLQKGSPLMTALSLKNDWKYDTHMMGIEVANELCDTWPLLNIYTFRPKNPFTKSLGYFDNKGAVHINIRRLSSLDHREMVGLLLHEYSHYCGFFHGKGFRRNYKNKDKVEYSVPYYLSENVALWT